MNRRTVHLYVFDGFADWEPSFAVARLNDPAWQLRPGRLVVKTVAAGGGRVRSMGGLAVVADLALEDLDPARSSLLILPGGNAWESSGGERAGAAAAAAFAAAGVPVAAICGATQGLARVGLLDDRAHTSNSAEYLAGVAEYRGHDHYVERAAVRDRSLITAGAAGAVAFAAEIFRELEVFEPGLIDGWSRLFGAHVPTPA